MTAQELIDSTKSMLTGLQVKDNDSLLLSFLNFAKNQIASDTLLWIDGEEITMVENVYEYTLATKPISIIDIYNEEYELVKRNSIEGYYQISPSVIRLANTYDGKKIYINYYITPDDYALDDTLDIPEQLLSAIQNYIMHKAFAQYKTEKDIMASANYYKMFGSAIQRYISQTDVSNTDSLLMPDMIKDKGFV